MKIVKLTILLIVIISSSAFSQSITLFDVDATDFPLMRAKFYAFDEAGNQQRPGINQLSITENGVERTITNVSCPPVELTRAVSSVLTIDVSVSMGWGSLPNLILAQEAARAWVGGLPLGKSECAITSFDHINYLNQDFTRDRERLLSVINSLKAQGGTDYDAALLSPAAGSLQISKNGKYKRVVVIITDGKPNRIPDVNSIVAEANRQNCVIYAVALHLRCPESLKEISTQTGGEWYENITTVNQARAIYKEILYTKQGEVPCTIEWESSLTCKVEETNVELHWNSVYSESRYIPTSSSAIQLEFNIKLNQFPTPEPGVLQIGKKTATARYLPFTVTDIKISHPAYDISPKSFTLNPDESIELTITYLPVDFGFTYCYFNFINETCPTFYVARGGINGIRPSVPSVKLIHPNGGEVFVAGSDTVITWTGVPDNEPVILEYRYSEDSPWVTITDSATGLSHPFKVPDFAGDTYSAKVSSTQFLSPECEGEEFAIGNQIWMQCNLDVMHYRNGDPILYAKNLDEWREASQNGIGAWCFYDYSPIRGTLNGKLYNWYAVNDPRGLAPEGWRVPSDEDWKELEMYLGMPQEYADSWTYRGVPYGAMLAGGFDWWRNGDLRIHNEFDSSGFSGLPSGYCSNGLCYSLRDGAYWWTSTEYSDNNSISRSIYYINTTIRRNQTDKSTGYSVRCIKE